VRWGKLIDLAWGVRARAALSTTSRDGRSGRERCRHWRDYVPKSRREASSPYHIPCPSPLDRYREASWSSNSSNIAAS